MNKSILKSKLQQFGDQQVTITAGCFSHTLPASSITIVGDDVQFRFTSPDGRPRLFSTWASRVDKITKKNN